MIGFDDMRRRIGVGPVGFLVGVIVFLIGFGYPLAVGDVEFSNVGRRPPIRLAVPALLYAAGVGLIVLSLGNLPSYLRLRTRGRTATGDVANGAADGRVACSGTVELDGSVPTPFRGVDAAAYTTRVLEKTNNIKHVGDGAATFRLDDGSGPVTVDPDGARLRLGERETAEVSAGDELPEAARAYCDEHGIDLNTNATRKFQEAALEPGETALVAGNADDGVLEASMVGEGDFVGRLRRRVLWGGVAGLVLTPVGLAGVFLITGAI